MIRIIKPYIKFEEIEESLRDIFESGWFTKGKNVAEFRRQLAQVLGVEQTFLTTSATTALWLCLKVLGIGPGDEVAISDFSFPATANVVEDLGAIPVFIDVDIHTYNMDPVELQARITKQTKAVIFVDGLGNPSGIEKIIDICQSAGLPLIEDAACAIGSQVDGKMCGSLSDFTCFSFHPRKLLTTGEGGAIALNNSEYYEIIARKLDHGSVFRDGRYEFVDYGYNFRMSEIQAAMGVVQLAKLSEIVRQRSAMRLEFVARLLPLGLIPQTVNNNVVFNTQSLVFTVPDHMDRNLLIQRLAEKGIETTIGTYCLSGTQYYRLKYNDTQSNASFLEKNTITLPCYKSVDVDFVCRQIAEVMR